jgi:peptidyl-prolyl cis-trans isomerase B (cyclophilin B)
MDKMDPVFTITMENGGVITGELYPLIAPESVKNFISLANKGFYNGLIFHRVIPGFMIQGGDPEGTGMGGPGWHIKGEFAANGWDNPIAHTRGVISMARAQDPNSAGSQFFIMHGDANYLDGQYAAFGKVIEGDAVIDQIANVQTGNYGWYMQDVPIDPVVIESLEIISE